MKEEIKDQIIEDIINYYAGNKLPKSYNSEQLDIIAEHNREWDALSCDPEGATVEQEQEQDALLEKVAEKVLAVK